MKRRDTIWVGIAAGVFCVVAITDLASNHQAPSGAAPVAASSAPSVSYAPSPSLVPPAASPPAGPRRSPSAGVDPHTATVARVVDGDTFVLSDDSKVRLLGIDSCEMSTDEGPVAKAALEAALPAGSQVTLTREPGVDRDQYGRELRYAATDDQGDLGVYMVLAPHTGVYGGHNDASPAYVTELQALDEGGRTCTDPSPTTSGSGTSGGTDVDVHHDDHNLPDGALTGGYCARKWWC